MPAISFGIGQIYLSLHEFVDIQREIRVFLGNSGGNQALYTGFHYQSPYILLGFLYQWVFLPRLFFSKGRFLFSCTKLCFSVHSIRISSKYMHNSGVYRLKYSDSGLNSCISVSNWASFPIPLVK